MAKVREAARLAQVESPEIRSLNAADLDVEELESRREIASMVPNADCWANNCKCYSSVCGIDLCL